ncbi:hypothetical protein E2120_26320 [Escherichia coli]|nr:hypothetical protein EO240_25780 [Escherichia coli]TEV16791.1 hypothetical protein E2136_23175 [Escherichia coli]TEV42482.1 hypothetical protein E2130_25860 [Escherichia coli]TEV97542.1 hypothetical protein E2123_25795 [Escherichia coli]TEV98051.1 hypothetical protein E2125_26030 [Escherichia coli]
MSTLSTIHRPSYFPAYTFPIFHFSSPAPAPHCHLSEVLLSYTCNKKLFFCNSGMICKRKLTAVCSHQTRIGNLDAHLI